MTEDSSFVKVRTLYDYDASSSSGQSLLSFHANTIVLISRKEYYNSLVIGQNDGWIYGTTDGNIGGGWLPMSYISSPIEEEQNEEESKKNEGDSEESENNNNGIDLTRLYSESNTTSNNTYQENIKKISNIFQEERKENEEGLSSNVVDDGDNYNYNYDKHQVKGQKEECKGTATTGNTITDAFAAILEEEEVTKDYDIVYDNPATLIDHTIETSYNYTVDDDDDDEDGFGFSGMMGIQDQPATMTTTNAAAAAAITKLMSSTDDDDKLDSDDDTSLLRTAISMMDDSSSSLNNNSSSKLSVEETSDDAKKNDNDDSGSGAVTKDDDVKRITVQQQSYFSSIVASDDIIVNEEGTVFEKKEKYDIADDKDEDAPSLIDETTKTTSPEEEEEEEKCNDNRNWFKNHSWRGGKEKNTDDDNDEHHNDSDNEEEENDEDESKKAPSSDNEDFGEKNNQNWFGRSWRGRGGKNNKDDQEQDEEEKMCSNEDGEVKTNEEYASENEGEAGKNRNRWFGWRRKENETNNTHDESDGDNDDDDNDRKEETGDQDYKMEKGDDDSTGMNIQKEGEKDATFVTDEHEEIEDEEVLIAMNMALTIENNPNLTPQEIRELIGGKTQMNEDQQREFIAAAIEKSKKERGIFRRRKRRKNNDRNKRKEEGEGDIQDGTKNDEDDNLGEDEKMEEEGTSEQKLERNILRFINRNWRGEGRRNKEANIDYNEPKQDMTEGEKDNKSSNSQGEEKKEGEDGLSNREEDQMNTNHWFMNRNWRGVLVGIKKEKDDDEEEGIQMEKGDDDQEQQETGEEKYEGSDENTNASEDIRNNNNNWFGRSWRGNKKTTSSVNNDDNNSLPEDDFKSSRSLQHSNSLEEFDDTTIDEFNASNNDSINFSLQFWRKKNNNQQQNNEDEEEKNEKNQDNDQKELEVTSSSKNTNDLSIFFEQQSNGYKNQTESKVFNEWERKMDNDRYDYYNNDELFNSTSNDNQKNKNKNRNMNNNNMETTVSDNWFGGRTTTTTITKRNNDIALPFFNTSNKEEEETQKKKNNGSFGIPFFNRKGNKEKEEATVDPFTQWENQNQNGKYHNKNSVFDPFELRENDHDAKIQPRPSDGHPGEDTNTNIDVKERTNWFSLSKTKIVTETNQNSSKLLGNTDNPFWGKKTTKVTTTETDIFGRTKTTVKTQKHKGLLVPTNLVTSVMNKQKQEKLEKAKYYSDAF